jgi:small GTP-binding protein
MFNGGKAKNKQIKEMKALIVGLDNAGKTTILKALSNENLKTISPTKGFNVKTLAKDNLKLTFWDLGGQRAIRKIWENYYEDNHAVVRIR